MYLATEMPQVFVGNNTAGFVVTYDGLTLLSMPDGALLLPGAPPTSPTITIPGNTLNSSGTVDIYLNVACGSNATASANPTFTFVSTCDSSIYMQEMLQISCMQPCPVLQWSTPTTADEPVVINTEAATKPEGLEVRASIMHVHVTCGHLARSVHACSMRLLFRASPMA